ncbi:MAG: ABC transporter substrate-binding protein [Anaerolineae bacterium]|jgi:NitT/TauT family transport system substrate-binding protein|nr:ABC transporter substrate-binding protein [Anaerolineae bacterium]
MLRIVRCLAGFALLLLTSVSLAQDALTPYRFLLTFIPNIQFAPLYAAIADGHYAALGLDVQIEYLNEPDVIDLVAAEQADFGMVSGEQVILAAARGRPVVYVYEWFQQYPVGVVFDAAADITTPADLAGQRVGIPGRFGASYSGFTALLLAAGMAEDAVQLEEIGFNAPEVFCLGAVDAAVVYINNEPLQIRHLAQAGQCGDVQDVRVLTVASDTPLVSNGLVTHQALIERDPDFVGAAIAAYDAGLKSVIHNPARAYLLSAAFVDTLPLTDALQAVLTEQATAQEAFLATGPDREAIAASRADLLAALRAQFTPAELIQMEVLLASIDLWDADRPGFSDGNGWENMQNTLLAMGLLAEKVNLDRVYSNAFVPATAD